MKRRKGLRILAIILIVIAFFLEGIYHFKIEPADRKSTVQSNVTEESAVEDKEDGTEAAKQEQEDQAKEKTETSNVKEDHLEQSSETENTQEQSNEAENIQEQSNKTANTKQEIITCTMEIVCNTITDTKKVTNAAIVDYIPKDGIILSKTKIEIAKGSSVYDVLQETAKQYGIQVESKYTPFYQSYYIEGIGYIYEFDAGELSGWKYQVNGTFPNYGCSSYQVSDGDHIVWCYTCDMGKDVGGSN